MKDVNLVALVQNLKDNFTEDELDWLLDVIHLPAMFDDSVKGATRKLLILANDKQKESKTDIVFNMKVDLDTTEMDEFIQRMSKMVEGYYEQD